MRAPFLASVLVFASCGGHGSGVSSPALTIIALDPAPSARDVEPQALVRIRFSEPVDPASLAGEACTLADAGGRVPARVELDAAGDTLVVTPLLGFGRGREIMGALSGNLRARSGRQIAGTQTWSFHVRNAVWERGEDLVASDATLAPQLVMRGDGTAFVALGTMLLALPDGDRAWARLDAIPVPGVLAPKAVHLGLDPDANLLVGIEGNPTPRSVDGFLVRSRGLSGWAEPERVGSATSLFLPTLGFRSTSRGDLTFTTAGCQGPSTCGTTVLWSAPGKSGAQRWLSAGGIFYSAYPRASDDGDGLGRHYWLRHASTGALDVVRYESELGTQVRYELAAEIPREEVLQLAIVATRPGPAFAWILRGSGASAQLEVRRSDAAFGFGAPTVAWSTSAPRPPGEHPRFVTAESAAGHVLVVVEEPLDEAFARLWALVWEPSLGTMLGPVPIAERALRGPAAAPRLAVALAERGEGLVVFVAARERGPALAAARYVPARGFEPEASVRVFAGALASLPEVARIDDQGRAIVLVATPGAPERHAVAVLR